MSEAVAAELGASFPRIVGAVAILLVGWLVALAGRVVVRRGLRYLKADDRLKRLTGVAMPVEAVVATVVFYGLVMFAFIAFFNTLDLLQVASPLQVMAEQVLGFIPNLVAAAILALAAWLIAAGVKMVVTRALARTALDRAVGEQGAAVNVSESIGVAAYWLTILLFLPAVLQTLGLSDVLRPVENLVDGVLSMLPNIAAAILLVLAGWLVAKAVGGLVTSALAAGRADDLGQHAGLEGKLALSRVGGLLVRFLVFTPALIAAIEALRVEALTGPATTMLSTMLQAVPHLLAALLIIGVGVLIARFAAGFLTSILSGTGFDGLPRTLGLEAGFSEGAWLPSNVAGKVVSVVIVLFACVEGAKHLGFHAVSGHIEALLVLGGQVLLGVVIIAFGVWLARMAESVIGRVWGKHQAWSGLVRFAILGVVFAMGLRAMGIADDIVRLAFGLTLGAAAVAAALAFGLGGRTAAGRQLDLWLAERTDTTGDSR